MMRSTDCGLSRLNTLRCGIDEQKALSGMRRVQMPLNTASALLATSLGCECR